MRGFYLAGIMGVALLAFACGGGGSGGSGTTVFYVSGLTGSDANPGTVDEPMATVQAAIDMASAGDEVRVTPNGGVYLSITLKEGVSVFGGYSSDFSQRDTASNQTRLYPQAAGAHPVNADSTITRATVLDGFYINGASSGIMSYGIVNDGGSPTIRDCAVFGGVPALRYLAVDDAATLLRALAALPQ